MECAKIASERKKARSSDDVDPVSPKTRKETETPDKTQSDSSKGSEAAAAMQKHRERVKLAAETARKEREAAAREAEAKYDRWRRERDRQLEEERKQLNAKMREARIAETAKKDQALKREMKAKPKPDTEEERRAVVRDVAQAALHKIQQLRQMPVSEKKKIKEGRLGETGQHSTDVTRDNATGKTTVENGEGEGEGEDGALAGGDANGGDENGGEGEGEGEDGALAGGDANGGDENNGEGEGEGEDGALAGGDANGGDENGGEGEGEGEGAVLDDDDVTLSSLSFDFARIQLECSSLADVGHKLNDVLHSSTSNGPPGVGVRIVEFDCSQIRDNAVLVTFGVKSLNAATPCGDELGRLVVVARHFKEIRCDSLSAVAECVGVALRDSGPTAQVMHLEMHTESTSVGDAFVLILGVALDSDIKTALKSQRRIEAERMKNRSEEQGGGRDELEGEAMRESTWSGPLGY
eukprot:CAMPEP_0175888826 /NCGR_PEP_ID=MMETSP0107_2-20121207/46938_1 /TAXON_ID=195067 ORGANISM="Goniomonas pacifica, Strain CCMP1869" /NCGR_SAMPLE_ID=MMETSP0107_2 /ASSEMBLY_ACC=CAM_ASM_000203 /LENGTH=466 /DNA_ID=CAMNT_0017209423 /DNA_START=462 /DNA_END=1863 /DNA_ORIENTATION=-